MAEQGGLEGSQPVDLSKHPSGIVPTLQNIVSTVNLDCKLDLKQIALQARNAEYNPKRFAAVIMRIREPKTTALIFASGKMVCTGAKSEQQSKLAARKYARIIQKLGFPAKFKDFKIQNIVGSCDVKFPIRLEGLAYSHGAFSSYEPELFPGLIYRMKQPKIVLLIFVSGKIVITGAKVRDETYTAFENIYPVLTEFRKVQQWRGDGVLKSWVAGSVDVSQGRLKLLLNSDGGRYKLVGGAFGDGFRSFHLHNGKLKFLGSATTKLHVFSASDKPRTRSKFYAEARLSSGGDSESESESESGSEGDGGSYDDEIDDFYGTGFDTDELACFRGLVLDISYRPVNVVCWKRAICLEFMEKADVLEYYDRTVNSPSGSYYIPAVLRVTACSKCNSKKGQKTLDEVNMKLKKLPKAPKDYDLLAIPLTGAALRMLRRRKGTPDEWRQYLPAEP
ncbi:unnamed protein product [Linum tenue]|uniref:Uncharacterized protein n=1 Tax=Linum tenue TaxID=586396 RepID=A0AAV0HFM0_9ROSI|nr:unnamed protein product [Linum tenue]CAI0384655.1 unnamed protein product [Linum tenue]